MKTVILCCASLEKEVRLAMARKEISYPLHILTDNNHDVPNRLREAIQRELDGIQDADRVLMAFGTCGGAMVGLRTGNFQLILPRVDDCLSLLMGSMEQRYEVATLLSEGMVYSDILERTGASSATISRVARSLTDSDGGYERIFARMKGEK